MGKTATFYALLPFIKPLLVSFSYSAMEHSAVGARKELGMQPASLGLRGASLGRAAPLLGLVVVKPGAAAGHATSRLAGFNVPDKLEEGGRDKGNLVNTTVGVSDSEADATSRNQSRALQIPDLEDFTSAFQSGTKFNDTTLRGVNVGVRPVPLPPPSAPAPPPTTAAGGVGPGIAGGLAGAPGGVVPNPVGGTSISGLNIGVGSGGIFGI